MGTVIQFQQNEWLAMCNLKSAIAFMRSNNEEGRYDQAIEKQKKTLKYFMTEVPTRLQ